MRRSGCGPPSIQLIEKLLVIDRLGQLIGKPCGQALREIFILEVGGKSHHRNFARSRIAAQHRQRSSWSACCWMAVVVWRQKAPSMSASRMDLEVFGNGLVLN